jgi:hypothetical protein
MKMKKLFTLLAAGGLAVASQAAALDWSYSAKSDNVGETVYVLIGSTPVTEWESVEALKGQAVGSAAVAKKGKNYGASGMVTSDKITKTSADVYYVVVSADGNSFGVTSSASMTASVYDPNAEPPESSLGANSSLSSSSITKSGIAWGTGGGGDPDPGPGGDVPEPPSGILLMIGGAALALRRRR